MGKMVAVIGVICVMVGSIVGVGFATGREIFLFFYGYNAYVVGACVFIAFSLLFFLFLYCAKQFNAYNTKLLFAKLFGKFYFIPEILITFSYFALMSTMLAGANLCLCGLLNMDERLPVFSFATAVICGWALMYNIKGLKAINMIIMPFIVLFVLFVTAKGGYSQGVITVKNTLFYASFNVFMTSGVIMPMAKEITLKQSLLCSIISAFALSILLMVILKSINHSSFSNLPMPIMYLAKQQNQTLYAMSSIVLYLAITSSLTANAYPLVNRLYSVTNSKLWSVVIVMFGGLITSLLGFAPIIDLLYPIMARFGAVIIVTMAVLLIKNAVNKAQKKKLQTSNNTCNSYMINE